MQFLYPISRQFPFDEVCGRIVRELEKRSWHVPDITVEFHDYGTGFRRVSYIKSQDFKLWFCRVQRLMDGGGYNDTAGVNSITIPKKEIRIHEDESGPTLYLYVGNDYERDRKNFMSGSKVNSKLDGKPRTYLQYNGGCICRATHGAAFKATGLLTALLNSDREALSRMHHTHRGRRPPILIHNNDLGREYEPEGDEPKIFNTDEVMEEFKQYLESVVLKMVLDHPLP